ATVSPPQACVHYVSSAGVEAARITGRYTSRELPMAFTVQDFQDLIRLLAEHPEWRAELRRHVLSDELLELPALVRQLADQLATLTTRVEGLAEAQARTEQRLERIEAGLVRLEAAIERLAEA